MTSASSLALVLNNRILCIIISKLSGCSVLTRSRCFYIIIIFIYLIILLLSLTRLDLLEVPITVLSLRSPCFLWYSIILPWPWHFLLISLNPDYQISFLPLKSQHNLGICNVNACSTRFYSQILSSHCMFLDLGCSSLDH